MNQEKQEAKKEAEKLNQEAKESDELLEIYKTQEKSREKIKTLEKYKEDHKPPKKYSKFFSKLGKVLIGSGKTIRKLQEAAGRLEIAQPRKDLDFFGNPKSKKRKKKGSAFISLVLILIIAVVFLSGCDYDYGGKQYNQCTTNLASNYCKQINGELEYNSYFSNEFHCINIHTRQKTIHYLLNSELDFCEDKVNE